MSLDLEKERIMLTLARSKGNWGGSYDRLEHFKRFPDLKKIIKELSKKGWVITHNKPKYTGISLNTTYKKEIIEFIESQMPEVKGIIQ